MTLEQLPHLNAFLNFLAATILLVGYGLIRMDWQRAHKWTMLAAVLTSAAFLASYCVYHTYIRGGKPFNGVGSIRYVYFPILVCHIFSAAVLPLFVMMTLNFAFSDNRRLHRIWARITMPIWLCSSITGMLVYLFLYVFNPRPPIDMY